MQNIFDIHDYDENFIEQFTSQTLPIFDRWVIKPLQNDRKILISGDSDESDKFIDFMNEHSAKDFPHPLLIVVGITEKNNPTKMLNSSMKYFKLKFDKHKGNELGTPLDFAFSQNPNAGNQQMMPMNFPINGKKQNYGNLQGFTYQDIQGIVDRNVSDATRSIRAEYEEINAKREADSIRRIAELETRMELYKLELRAGEVEQKEKRLQEMIDEFEDMRAEGMGTVKDYTKTIAGGLLELGKFALGMEDKEDSKSKKDKKANKSSKEEIVKEDLKGTSIIDDDGFTEANVIEEDNAFDNLMGMIKDLSDEERFELLDILLPEDDNTNDDNPNEENDDNNEDTSENTEKKATKKTIKKPVTKKARNEE